MKPARSRILPAPWKGTGAALSKALNKVEVIILFVEDIRRREGTKGHPRTAKPELHRDPRQRRGVHRPTARRRAQRIFPIVPEGPC